MWWERRTVLLELMPMIMTKFLVLHNFRLCLRDEIKKCKRRLCLAIAPLTWPPWPAYLCYFPWSSRSLGFSCPPLFWVWMLLSLLPLAPSFFRRYFLTACDHASFFSFFFPSTLLCFFFQFLFSSWFWLYVLLRLFLFLAFPGLALLKWPLIINVSLSDWVANSQLL